MMRSFLSFNIFTAIRAAAADGGGGWMTSPIASSSGESWRDAYVGESHDDSLVDLWQGVNRSCSDHD